MALPKIESARYTTELPVTKLKVDYRPFLVKEQKILLQAMESEESSTINNSLTDLLKACVLTDDINIDYIPMADVEYLFIQIRIKSAGETADLLLPCDCHEDAETPVQIDLREIEVVGLDESDNKIQLTTDVGITLQYPSLSSLSTGVGDINTIEMFDMIASCVETVYTSDEVQTRDDFTKKDILEFINSLSTDQFTKIQSFFETMPKVIKKVSYTCKECDKVNERDLQGIADFFG